MKTNSLVVFLMLLAVVGTGGTLPTNSGQRTPGETDVTYMVNPKTEEVTASITYNKGTPNEKTITYVVNPRTDEVTGLIIDTETVAPRVLRRIKQTRR